MIRYKLNELISKKSKDENRKITLSQVAREIGVQRAAMSKMAQNKGYGSTTKTLNALCVYFDCKIEDLIEFVKE
ncbi:helix-turn-helix domain-containing protein [Parashewanella tropica]|uniref:helix-turn-helix domain-containing protein n=1 Tax=Parashewanella tropica TaxID=2547970 RepID=UPI0014791C50|nr:helix-turn-helix transcriptional regulator [Parashewanella tropica]